MSLEKTISCIKTNNNFLITTHTNLEGDALGSELAFYRLLEAYGRRAIIINEDSLPYGYDFLPDINIIKKFSRYKKRIKFDCFVTLDCSDLKRCGRVFELNTEGIPILNIDHHISNTGFGDVNWIEPYVSSTCEMIYKLYKKMRLPLDRDTAISLYAGILADTGSFHYSNTSSFTHKAVSELMKYNLDTVRIYKSVYENIPFQDMELLSQILPTMRLDLQGKIIWFQIKRNLLKNKRISFDLTEYILSLGRAIKGTEVAVLFKENLGQEDEVRVNLRSQCKVDVNKIARFFGGGGHKTASGFTIKGRIEDVRRKVLNKIRDSFK